MTFDQLIAYKLKMHHLHRDYRIKAESGTSPAKDYRALAKLETILTRVYTELERRKNPAVNTLL